MGVAVHMNDVYWVDRNLQTIFKAPKFLENNTQPLRVRTGLQRLRDIAIYDVANQPSEDSNPCSKLGKEISAKTKIVLKVKI